MVSNASPVAPVPCGSLTARRLSSPVFNKLGFAMVTHFLSYERGVLALSGNYLQFQDMRELLKIETTPTAPGTATMEIASKPLSRDNWNAAQHGRLCSFLCLYRLLDLLASLRSLGEKTPIMMRLVDLSGIEPLHGYERLTNWPQQLLAFQGFLGGALNDHSVALDSTSSRRLLHFLKANGNTLAQNKIVCNLTVAATHLAFIKEKSFQYTSLPDLPDQINDEVIQQAPTEQEKVFLKELDAFVRTIANKHTLTASGGVSLASFRAPFHLSVAILPLYLLFPLLLAKKSWNRNTILRISSRLGNGKPEALLKVEMVLWEVILAMADGVLNPSDVLEKLKKALPWPLIQSALSGNERSWFFLRSSSSSQTIRGRSVLSGANLSAAKSPSSQETVDHAHMDVDSSGLHDLAIRDMPERMPSHFVLNGTDQAVCIGQTERVDSGGELAPLGEHMESLDDLMDVLETRTNNVPTSNSSVEKRDNAEEEGGADNVEEEGGTDDEEGEVDGEGGDGSEVDGEGGNGSEVAGEGGDGSEVDGEGEDGSDERRKSGEEEEESDLNETEMDVDGGDENQGSDEDMDIDKPAPMRQSTRIQDSLRLGVPEIALVTKSSARNSSQKTRTATLVTPVPALPKKPISSALKTLNRPPSSSFSTRKDAKLTAQGLKLDPIDLELISLSSSWEPDNLEALRPIKEEEKREADAKLPERVLLRHKCNKSYTVFGPTGEEFVLEPEFHFTDYVMRFEEIMSGIEKSYIHGRPLHIADPCRSVIAVLSYEEFLNMPHNKLHSLAAQKNIVVRGVPVPDHKFDAKGLDFIHPLHSPVSIQVCEENQSLNTQNRQNSAKPQKEVDTDDIDMMEMHIPTTITGTLQDFLDEALSNRGCIMNVLDLPLCHESTAPSPYSSDSHAWHHTRGRPGSLSSETFPTTDTCWALLGSGNTITFFHIDSDGFNTRGLVIWGGKLWILYRERHELPLSSRHVFFDEGFYLDRYKDKAKYDLEAIYLTKGDLLLMRANQPHAVYGKEPTIIHGGHFYLTSLMEKTAESIIHSFVMDQFLTNTVHYRSRQLLRRIVDFCRLGFLEKKLVQSDACHHLPDTTTFSGLVNLLSLCNLVVLGNVLDFRTYSAPNQKAGDDLDPHQRSLMEMYDRNNIPKQERFCILYARGIALELMGWVREFCEVKSPKGDIIPDLPSEYMCRQLAALLKYKAQAEQEGIVGAPHCTPEMLRKQVQNVLCCDDRLKKYWTNRLTAIDDTALGFGSKSGYSICWKAGAIQLRTHEQLLRDGTTPLDHKFKEGEVLRSAQDHQMASGNLFYTDEDRPRKRTRS
ncbi:hypothetical protein CVT25_006959 [Psilocybe cyanescens]|uniref:JmjC domain-containing protein n=1 Tax=Psilocybe cyanescens TaxID=93625 RepID=A0A409WYE2_PSICY|nr:hypothetical protein CVT25_006959 [Psilocybe cyanescens]